MKLTEQQINEMKELRSNGNTQMSLAVKFGVSLGTIAYHTNEKNRLRQIEYSKNHFKNLPTEKKQQIYLKRKDYLKEYNKRKNK
jgi:Zn-dependent peptidase ImmA (M78 family)